MLDAPVHNMEMITNRATKFVCPVGLLASRKYTDDREDLCKHLYIQYGNGRNIYCQPSRRDGME